MLLRLVVFITLSVIIIGKAAADCPTEEVILTSATCSVTYEWTNANGTMFNSSTAIGTTSTIDDGDGCVFNLTGELLDVNAPPCGLDGECSTDGPLYECICPWWTDGAYCCQLTASLNHTDNSTISGAICPHNGTCIVGGNCECESGYGGPWCCPMASHQSTACGNGGCCLSDGTCECSSGYSGVACEIYQVSRISATDMRFVGIVVGSVVGGVVVVGVALSIVATTLGTQGATTAATAAYTQLSTVVRGP